MNLLSHVRLGDWLILAGGLTGVLALGLAQLGGDVPRRAVVRAGGEVVAEVDLAAPRRILAQGPLGVSVIEVEAGRVRVAADPGPRQLCVRQGWLSHAGDIALCLPNQVSVELVGSKRRFDSLVY
ncbi:MAG: NusG domain II-containing protein [Burkholderiales bacterium]|jgi:hypothetical protein|nr:NusG domain II-containing protein [Burkholderiales bacterium]